MEKCALAKVVVALSVLLADSEQLIAQVALIEGGIKSVSAPANFESGAGVGQLQWSFQHEDPGAKYLRVRFERIKDSSENSYSVVVKDRRGKVVDRFEKEMFVRMNNTWTKAINGDAVEIQVVAEHRPRGLEFNVTKIAFQRNSGAPFSLTWPDDREAIKVYRTALPELFTAARAVAKLGFIKDDLVRSCTGFLIAQNLLITNHHCISTNEVCATAIATFGYEHTETGLSVGEQYRCVAVVDSDLGLDFARIKLEGSPGAVWGHLDFAARTPQDGEQLFMVQHPAGEPKQVSRKDCFVSTEQADGYAVGVDFGHKCDTLGGSSGSPILDRNYKVVGLHHVGFDDTNVRWKSECRAVRASALRSRLSNPQ